MSCFTSQQHINLFKESLHYVFLRWTALQLAIEHSMGGSSTLNKVVMLGEYILEFFAQNGLRIDPQNLEENLIEFFEESFQVELEDGSAQQVSKLICQLFKDIGNGDLIGFERAKELASRATGASGQSRRIQGDDDDDGDSSSDSDSEDGTLSNDSDMHIEESPVVPAPKPGPIIDEDGFETVQKGRRRR